MKSILTTCALLLGTAIYAQAPDNAIITPVDVDFEDASFALENAIIDRGLNIEYTSYVGEMLARTGADVGSSKEIFKDAQIFIFCSASLSRQAMEANVLNIVHCPYNLFVYETDEGVFMGHRDYPDGDMDNVEALLASIVADAAS